MAIEIMKVFTSFILFASMVVVREGSGIEQAILASVLVFSVSFFGDFLVITRTRPAFSQKPTFLSKTFGLMGCVSSAIASLFTFMCMIGAMDFRISNLNQQPVFYLSAADGSMIGIPQINITWILLFYYLLPFLLHLLLLIRAGCLNSRKKTFTLKRKFILRKAPTGSGG